MMSHGPCRRQRGGGRTGASDAEEPPVRHGLHRGVEEGGGRAVGVEVDDVVLLQGVSVLVHEHAGVPGADLHTVMVISSQTNQLVRGQEERRRESSERVGPSGNYRSGETPLRITFSMAALVASGRRSLMVTSDTPTPNRESVSANINESHCGWRQ
jgi:hypothetical protein